MKKLLVFLLAFMLITSVACTEQTVQPSEGEAPAEQKQQDGVPSEKDASEEQIQDTTEFSEHYRFAWIMPDMFNPFWTYMRQGAEKAVLEYAEKGIKVDVQQMAPINTFNIEEQIAIFENAITMGVDGIGICVIDQNAVITQVDKAFNAGIPTIALSTDIPNSKRLVYDGHDDEEWAKKVAEYVINKNGGKGNYIILEGLKGNYISDQRTAGYRRAIEEAGCTLLEVQPANFSTEEGMSLMENMLTKYPSGEISGVFTVNDNVALGVIEAIDAVRRQGEILIGSVDGNEQACEAIKAGTLCTTFLSNPWGEGYAAVQSLIEYLQTGKTAEIVDVDCYLVTQENADEALKLFDYWSQFYKG